MMLKPGLRLASTTCATQIIVVRGNEDIDVRCGGRPMTDPGADVESGEPQAPFAGGTLVGKRYVSDELGVELLCTRSGAGSLSIGQDLLPQKDAKPLPASD